jgi:2-C-methyl-D-erythritol 2,4-cyclodiphosphate synthase
MFRAGLGFDNHRLVEGRPLLLGGLEIPSPVGAEAHSDGDVLLHALCDALFGAAGLGDIGEHFPDGDPRWKGQASTYFLEEALRLVQERGYRLVNLDATVFLEKVRLSSYKRKIAEHLRRILKPYWDVEEDAINIKAKTMERCDAVGRGEAVEAQVIVLLRREEP